MHENDQSENRKSGQIFVWYWDLLFVENVLGEVWEGKRGGL